MELNFCFRVKSNIERFIEMEEIQATKIAEIMGGDTWQSGGGIWLVIIRRNDGHLVVISDEVICEYASEENFESSSAVQSVFLL